MVPLLNPLIMMHNLKKSNFIITFFIVVWDCVRTVLSRMIRAVVRVETRTSTELIAAELGLVRRWHGFTPAKCNFLMDTCAVQVGIEVVRNGLDLSQLRGGVRKSAGRMVVLLADEGGRGGSGSSVVS